MTDRVVPPTVHLHIGTMKSGTSYVQHILEQQQSALAPLGIRYPGNTGPAVNDVLGRRGTPGQGDITNAWDGLVADIRGWTGSSVVVSMEFLGLATEAQAEQIVGALEPSPVHVVLTVRDISRTLQSAWQQTTKNRGTTTWPDFAVAVMAAAANGEAAPHTAPADLDPGQQFWRHHDVVGIARRWAGVVGAARVTVVTVPRAGSPLDVLWERFAAATGIDARRVPPIGTPRRNPSLGLPQAELLRRLNERLGGGLDATAYRRLVTGVLARRVLRTPEGATRVPPLPTSAVEWAVRHGESVRADLATLGVAVVGDLAELVPAPDATTAPAASAEVSDSDVAAAAVMAAAALVVEIAEVQAQRRREHTSP